MRDMTAALIIKDGKILLVHNTKHNRLRIEPPGGKREDNESLEECVIREVQEELGISIEPKELLGAFDTNSPEGNFRVYMYISEIKSGKPFLMEPDKISGFGWYTFDEIEKFKEQGILVPNMCLALDELKKLFNPA